MLIVMYQIGRYIDTNIKPDLSAEGGIARSLGQFLLVTLVGLILFLLGLGRMCFRLLDLVEEENENTQ